MGRLAGKVAIITGSASGQGKAEAILFAKEGAKVILADIQKQKVYKVAEDIQKNGGEAIAYFHDISIEEHWSNLIRAICKKYGKVDILINNASTPASHDDLIEEWRRVLNINMIGTFLGMKYVVPVMKEIGGGSIINISSVAGLIAGGVNPYTASKGAIRAISRSAAVEYAKYQIRVNSVYPGMIHTPMTEDLLANEGIRKHFESVTPLPFLGESNDVAYGVLYLASDESRFTTGTELVIDGGWTSH
ncbi:glucose 1-dehydrogenase [Shimazuella sp. AN120528]|uniref:SDR family NAD(P)-dependent oxidoreductase n=1 Tax=Shimazuella soli TaxID=1892854 RepID=UPI001F0D3D39|nr:glucose 1-dehydrogenase [Shimazuella soli]MCH5586207.1 glucose 1-dehydrogenase [Shimazuella soli]